MSIWQSLKEIVRWFENKISNGSLNYPQCKLYKHSDSMKLKPIEILNRN